MTNEIVAVNTEWLHQSLFKLNCSLSGSQELLPVVPGEEFANRQGYWLSVTFFRLALSSLNSDKWGFCSALEKIDWELDSQPQTVYICCVMLLSRQTFNSEPCLKVPLTELNVHSPYHQFTFWFSFLIPLSSFVAFFLCCTLNMMCLSYWFSAFLLSHSIIWLLRSVLQVDFPLIKSRRGLHFWA